jgi:hypothetical protein
VVVDEAHHCIYNVARTKLDEALESDRFVELSATFPKGVDVHYKVSMREAIEEAVVADYRVRVVELTAVGNKRDAILQSFKKHYVDWGPTLAVFNDVQGASDFAKALREAGIEAECVSGDTPAEIRKKITERLESGETSVVCCCKCWNEGKDIPALRTVAFCDARDSDVNKRQLAQRASRLHRCKPYYNVVLFVQEELEEVEGLLRSFADDDPAFKASAHAAFGKGGGPVNSRITVEHEGDAEVVSETLMTRLGEVLLGKRWVTIQEKVDQLIALGKMPKPDEKLYNFLMNIRGTWTGKKCNTHLSPEQVESLEASWFKAIIDKWTNLTNLSFAQKLEIVCKLESKPTNSAKAHGFNIGKFVDSALQAVDKGSKAYETLNKVKWFVEALAELQNKRENPEPPEAQKIQWVSEHGKVPTTKTPPLSKQHNDQPYSFKIRDFWSCIMSKAAAGKESKEQKVLEKHEWYKDAVKKLKAKKTKNPLGTVPTDKQIEWLIQLGHKPTWSEKPEREYDGKKGPWNAGTFWSSIQGNWKGKLVNELSPEQKEIMNAGCGWINKL